MTTNVKTTEPTADATATATAEATTDNATPEPGTAETTAAEMIAAEYRELYAMVAEWRERERELQAKFDATFDGDDCDALRRHRQPGLIPVWKKIIENRRRYLAEVVPAVQADMRRVREPRERPYRLYSEERERLHKRLLETLAAMGFAEFAIDNAWNNYLEEANTPLEAQRVAAEAWQRSGHADSISSEQYQATKVEEAIEKLEKQLADAKALATREVTPTPPPPPPKPPTVYPGDEEDASVFSPRVPHGAVGPRMRDDRVITG